MSYLPAIATDQPKDPEAPPAARSRILAKRGISFVPLLMSDIAVFYWHSKITYAICFHGTKYMISESLTELEGIVDPKLFFRVNRTTILHVNSIKEFKPIEFSKIAIELQSPGWMKEEILVSQFTAPEFKYWIGNL